MKKNVRMSDNLLSLGHVLLGVGIQTSTLVRKGSKPINCKRLHDWSTYREAVVYDDRHPHAALVQRHTVHALRGGGGAHGHGKQHVGSQKRDYPAKVHIGGSSVHPDWSMPSHPCSPPSFVCKDTLGMLQRIETQVR
jgi:hypothetical protein